jgi:hypothetical protein
LREINGEQIHPNVLKDVFSIVEPTVIHVRSGVQGSEELKKSIIKELTSQKWGYSNLDVQELISEEQRRKTHFGLEFHKYMSSHKPIPA